MTDRKQVAVAVAAIVDEQQRILIARRSDDQHQGGKWEFPGGKIEANESTPIALVRELKEELGVDCQTEQMSELIEICFDYPDKSVRLDTWLVELNQQQAESAFGAEGQPVRWVKAAELSDYQFPDANQPILESLLARLG